jgi:hypothetical protein
VEGGTGAVCRRSHKAAGQELGSVLQAKPDIEVVQAFERQSEFVDWLLVRLS